MKPLTNKPTAVHRHLDGTFYVAAEVTRLKHPGFRVASTQKLEPPHVGGYFSIAEHD